MPDRVGHGSLDTNTNTSTEANDDNFIFYPAYCYNASPTWFKWVKLTAYDVHHHLTIQPIYHAAPSYANTDSTRPWNQPLLLFYLNHPVQFVQLVGIVVTFENFFEKFWLFVLDDSSGATIEVNCRKPQKPTVGEGGLENGHTKPQEKDPEAEARYAVMEKLEIGTVVLVKGQITTFRNLRQLQLERVSIVNDTNQEMGLVAARTEFYEKVLNHAWEVLPSDQKRLRDRALGESKKDNEHAIRRQKRVRLRAEKEKRDTEKILRQYEQEQKRQLNAERAGRA